MNPMIVRFFVGFMAAIFAIMPLRSASSAEVEAKPPLKIVQLGDSYSAGNGARSESGERNYYGIEGCYRSHTNWGEQFANSLKDTYAVTYINRACSGGVIADILNPRLMGSVFKDNFSDSCPSSKYPDEETISIDESQPALCQRVIDPQIDAIDKSVDLVVMTMGGNDVQFDRIVVECFVPGPRDPAGCRDAVEDARDELENVRSGLIETLGQIREKLRPDARVILVTYSHVTQDADYQLENWLTNDSYAAAQEIRSLGLEGDEYQRAAVVAANQAAREKYGVTEDYIVFFDSTKALFDGHEPDPAALSENPDRWLHELVFSLGYANVESYHYNPLGHQNLGNALSPFETFGAVPGSFGTNADLDVAFVVDTTGSMGDDIAQVRADLSSLVGQLAATTDSYRVAVVSYRDFPQRTGWNGDYPSRIDQTFTEDLDLIQAAIDSLTADGGEDEPETVFSGIQASIGLPWRPGVTKIAIVIGDAPALSPEPISNLTAAQIVANSIAVDPVQVIGVDTGNLNSNGAVGQIAVGTGGSVILGTSGLTTKISEILDSVAKQPFAWAGQAYSGKIGEPILFDASGSFDPSGSIITLYEWDFDGDGIFDLQTQEATATYVYDGAFDGVVVLRVTGEGGTALASARTIVNTEGFASQGDEDSCQLDENGQSIILDEEGRFIPCRADNLPGVDQEGVQEVTGPTTVSVEIDIKPGSGPNSINCRNLNGVITVAVLTTDSFNAQLVDHSGVTFEGAIETHIRRNGQPQRHEVDVDRDGDFDLVFHFRLGNTDLTCSSSAGTISGVLSDGTAFNGTDTVRMVQK